MVFLQYEFSNVEQDLSLCKRPLHSDAMLAIIAVMTAGLPKASVSAWATYHRLYTYV